MVFGYTVVKRKDLEKLLGLLYSSERRIEDLREALEAAGVDVGLALSELTLIRQLLVKEQRGRRAEVVIGLLGVAAVVAQPVIAYEYANLRDGDRPSVVAEFQTSCSELAHRTEGVAVPASLVAPAIDPTETTVYGEANFTTSGVATATGEVTSFDMEEQLGESVKREIADRDQARLHDDEPVEITGTKTHVDVVSGTAPVDGSPDRQDQTIDLPSIDGSAEVQPPTVEATGQRSNPIDLEDILSKPEPGPYQPPRPPTDE